MPRAGILHLTVFVASPGDVRAERDHVVVAASSINRTEGARGGFHLDVKLPETHVRPGAGRAQGVINEQIGEYDMFVGLMWKRLGSPTGIAPSGTVEEYRRAYQRWARRKKNRPSVMFYFRTGATRLDEVDPEQWKKVQAFKRRMHAEGLARDYATPAVFKDLIREHLLHEAYAVLERHRGTANAARVRRPAPAPRAPAPPTKSAPARPAHKTRSGPPAYPLPDVPRRFTDEERRAFITAAYRDTLRYFQSAARTLNRTITHARVTVTKQSDDAFYAEAFAHGERRTGCRIWLSDSWRHIPQIAYAEGRLVTGDRTAGMNDSASVEDGRSALSLQLSGMDFGRFTSDPRGRTAQQVAEHFWRRFTASLIHPRGVMVTVRVGHNERPACEADESWLREQLAHRAQAGSSVCVQVEIHTGEANLLLSSGACRGGGGGTRRRLSREEERIFDLWQALDLGDPEVRPHDVLRFLRKLSEWCD